VEFVGQEMWLPEEILHPLEEGRYYLFQLSGCSVITKEGVEVGSVRDIFFIEGNNLLVVENFLSPLRNPFVWK
jgi:16S rRNA processing protein RimM